MYPLGHIGISLFLYAPVAYLLVVRDRRNAALTGVFILCLLANAPDVDALVPWLAHRGVTHSFTAAVAFGGVCAIVGWLSGLFDADRRRDFALFGGFLGGFGVVSHLVGDVITPWGVRPFLPFGTEMYTLSLVWASDPLANAVLFATGGIVLSVAVHWAQVRSAPTPDPVPEPSIDTATDPR